MFGAIVVAILTALALGAFAYFTGILSFDDIFNFFKKRFSIKMVSKMGVLMKEIAKNPNISHINMSDLKAKKDETIVAEYDERTDDINIKLARDLELDVENMLRKNGGIMLIDLEG